MWSIPALSGEPSSLLGSGPASANTSVAGGVASDMVRHLADAVSSAVGNALRQEVLPLTLSMVSFAGVAIFAGIEAFRRDSRDSTAATQGAQRSASLDHRGRRQRGSPNEVAATEEGRAGAGSAGGRGTDRKGSRMHGDHRRTRSKTPPPAGPVGGRTATPPTPSSDAGTEAMSVDSSGSKRAPRSSGDSTRKAFYKLIFVALVTRLLLLPLEAFYFSPASPNVHSENGMCTSSPMCIFSRTLPELAFASAFSLIVLFYAQLAGTAAGGGPRGLSSILIRRGLFEGFNALIYGVYGLLFLFTGIISLIPYTIFQAVVWSMLCIIYLLLFLLLSYFGPVLVTLLKPSLARRSALACRLIFMCVLCALVFLSRTICFGLAVWLADVQYTHGVIPNLVIPFSSYGSVFGRDALGYALLELLPSLAILLIMHQPRKASSSTESRGVGVAIPQSQSQGMTPPSGPQVASGRAHGGVIGVVGGTHQQPHPRQQQQYHHNHSPGTEVGVVGGIRRVTSGSAPKRTSAGGAAGGGSGVGNRSATGTLGSEAAALLPAQQGGSPAYGTT